MTALRNALDAALSAHERHPRPGLPVRGFVLDRAAGTPRPAIRHADGRTVIAPDGHIHRMTPAPDRRRIAIEWAEDASEDAVLGIVDVASGTLRLHPEIRLRYDTVLWIDDSRTLEVVASRDDALVALDVDTGALTATPVEPAHRTRLFPSGARGVLACRTGDEGTTLIDRATGRLLGRWSALYGAFPLPDGVLVWHAGGLDALAPSGTARWALRDESQRITDVTVEGSRIVVLVVRDGRTVVADVDAAGTREVFVEAASETTVTGVRIDDGILYLAVEGPLTPPRIVTETDAAPDALAGETRRLDLPARDGETLTAHIAEPAAGSGPRPLLLACYGGFGVPHLPVFEPTIPAWVAHGGAYVTAQIRGGGERGASWRAAGSGARKQQAVDDLADIARGLVDRGITRPDLLVLVGASLGGVIAASCGFQHPGLCVGVVATAAPLDLLSLADHPLGAGWRSEFGDDGSPESRERLRRLSPLAIIEDRTDAEGLPAFLGITLGRDTRVRATDTRRTVEALERLGAPARTWTAPSAGHGTNALDDLHALGITVLEFSADVTSGGTP
ncbi:prolyl oligopeptidase [Microbacterium testaceum]|uniref:prolyl oligopeptidase family serine peptidase n=1 Tax=Microbacterium TaxID=33882 RepID=UPI0027835E6C|nr:MULTISPECIES: prolyl oligopeptidase family serine peptidase [Microbacterium]MDQ1111538.1 prolyl oligopeptidase [Microbacterium testaceum]MDR6097927.1 prolyl oligopeptidase [Microbacterium sp. SORGH_AS_0454]